MVIFHGYVKLPEGNHCNRPLPNPGLIQDEKLEAHHFVDLFVRQRSPRSRVHKTSGAMESGPAAAKVVHAFGRRCSCALETRVLPPNPPEIQRKVLIF